MIGKPVERKYNDMAFLFGQRGEIAPSVVRPERATVTRG
jgi:hypothetical protein